MELCGPCSKQAFSQPIHACRDPKKCPKNHISFYKDRHGCHASLKAIHFKNESMKGAIELPLSQSLLMPITLLERGINECMPNSSMLFSDSWGLPYKLDYFSTISSQAISIEGHHITANHVRHMFVTLWQDFINHPSTKLLDLTMHQMAASAAELMINSPTSWDIAYDDNMSSRAINRTIAVWPHFVEFVKQAHLDTSSMEEWDPLTIDMSMLTTTS